MHPTHITHRKNKSQIHKKETINEPPPYNPWNQYLIALTLKRKEAKEHQKITDKTNNKKINKIKAKQK